jgi:hypothetical protein
VTKETDHVGEPALDPERVLDRLKENDHRLRWAPLPPNAPGPSPTRQPSDRRALEYLHTHWELPDVFDPAAAPRGVQGRIVALFGRLTFRVLGPYLRAERELLATLVQVNAELEERCDQLSREYRELSEAVLDRQVAEARNQAELALWLHAREEARGPADASPTTPVDDRESSPTS